MPATRRGDAHAASGASAAERARLARLLSYLAVLQALGAAILGGLLVAGEAGRFELAVLVIVALGAINAVFMARRLTKRSPER